jgi:tetratricopeptide (TPR) repeat protein
LGLYSKVLLEGFAPEDFFEEGGNEMKIPCDYHPTRAAHFCCHKCGKSFCPECVSERKLGIHGEETSYFCPQCNVPASQFGMGNILPPFWQSLPKFFLYPFQWQPLLFMVALAVVGVLFPNSFLVKLVLWVALVKYSYAVLVNTAHGNLGPPKDTASILTGDISIAFKQIGIFAILGVALAWVASNLGMFIGVLSIIFALLSIPAMIMTLAATDSLFQAVNPLVFVPIMFRIGWPYLLMYFFLLLLAGGPAALAPYLVVAVPPFLQMFLFNFAEQYYTIMTYNLMGYVLLQYHEEIGFQVDYEQVKTHLASPGAAGADSKKDSPETRMLAEADRLIKEGHSEEAIRFIAAGTGGHFTDLPLAQRFYHLLKLGGQTAELPKHCKVYIPLLVAKNRFTEAYRIYKECLANDPLFELEPKTMYSMAEWLGRSGDPKVAMKMAVGFIKANPAHILLPDAYFLVAQILHERLNNRTKAKEILQAILTKYPEHDLAAKVRMYWGQMA